MSAGDFLGRLRRADPLLLWGFGLAGAVLLYTLINLTTRSLWWDELFTASLASPSTPYADAVAQIRADVHPPLYFFGARLWLGLLNTSSDFALRAFNLLPYAFAVWLGARALRDKRTAHPMALWLVLFFTSFGVFWYLQEARMYAMMIAQALCASLVVLDYEKRRFQPITFGYAATLAVVFVVLPLGHWFSMGFAGCVLLALFGWALLERKKQFAKRYAALFFVLGILLGGIGLAWIAANARSTLGAVHGYGNWVYGGTLSLYGLRITALGLMVHALALNPILIAASAWGIWQVVKSPTRNVGPMILLIVSVILGVAILVVSLVAAMYQTRNFVWAIAPLTLFAAIGLQSVFGWLNLSRVRQTAAIVGILGVSLLLVPVASPMGDLQIDSWRVVGRTVASTPGCETADIHATAPWLGATPTDLDRRMSQRIYGHYSGHPERIKLVLKGETLRVAGSETCPVILWMAQTSHENAVATARQMLGPAADKLSIQSFAGHILFLRPQSTETSVASRATP
jgi:hypothetical protein